MTDDSFDALDPENDPPERLTFEQLNRYRFTGLEIRQIIEAYNLGKPSEATTDAFSGLHGQKLWDAVGPINTAVIQRYISEPLFQAKTARWVLRGLDIDRALLKGFVSQLAHAFHKTEADRYRASHPSPCSEAEVNDVLRVLADVPE